MLYWFWVLIGALIAIVACFLLFLCCMMGRRVKVDALPKEEDVAPLGKLGVPSILPNGGKHPAGTPLVVIPVPHASVFFRIGNPHNVHELQFQRLDGQTIVLGAPHPCAIPGRNSDNTPWQVGTFVIQAFSYAPGRDDSDIVTTLVEITPPTGEVMYSHPPGEYQEPFQLTLFHPDTTNIMWTADGRDPWECGVPYTGSLWVDQSCEIRAAAQGSLAPAVCKSFTIPSLLPSPIAVLNDDTQVFDSGTLRVCPSDKLAFASSETGAAVFYSAVRSPLHSAAPAPTSLYTAPLTFGPGTWVVTASASKAQRKDSAQRVLVVHCSPYPPVLRRLPAAEVASLLGDEHADAVPRAQDDASLTVPCGFKLCVDTGAAAKETPRTAELGDEARPLISYLLTRRTGEVSLLSMMRSASSETSSRGKKKARRGKADDKDSVSASTVAGLCEQQAEIVEEKQSLSYDPVLLLTESGVYTLEYYATDPNTGAKCANVIETLSVEVAVPPRLDTVVFEPRSGNFVVPQDDRVEGLRLAVGNVRKRGSRGVRVFVRVEPDASVVPDSVGATVLTARNTAAGSAPGDATTHECRPADQLVIKRYGRVKVTAIACYEDDGGSRSADDYFALGEDEATRLGVSVAQIAYYNIAPPVPRLSPDGSGSYGLGFAAYVHKPKHLASWAECMLHYSVHGWVGGVEIEKQEFKNAPDGTLIGLGEEGRYIVRARCEVFLSEQNASDPQAAACARPPAAGTPTYVSEEIEAFYEVSAGATMLAPPTPVERRVSAAPSPRAAPPTATAPPAFYPVEKFHAVQTLHVYLQAQYSPSTAEDVEVYYAINEPVHHRAEGEEHNPARHGTLYSERCPIRLDGGEAGAEAEFTIYALARPVRDVRTASDAGSMTGSLSFTPKVLSSRVVQKTYCLVSPSVSDTPRGDAPPKPCLTCHASELSVQLKTPDEHIRALYTIDGSPPATEAGGSTFLLPHLHAFAVPAHGTTSVRAIAVDTLGRKAPSRVVSKCFVEGTLPQMPLARNALGVAAAATAGKAPEAEDPDLLVPPVFVAHARVVSVVATCSQPSAVVRYTIDGTLPTPLSQILPETGLQIAAQGTQRPATLRCVAYGVGGAASGEVVQDFMQILGGPATEPCVTDLSPGKPEVVQRTQRVAHEAEALHPAADVGAARAPVPVGPGAEAGRDRVPSPRQADTVPPPAMASDVAAQMLNPPDVSCVQSTQSVDPFVRGLQAERLRQAKKEAVLSELRQQERVMRAEVEQRGARPSST
eukprot:Rhum_TRINITY_DN10322_c0_g1::Rhum_TRINITY_DN10322_c0_g1_i1::g.38034::m.38034